MVKKPRLFVSKIPSFIQRDINTYCPQFLFCRYALKSHCRCGSFVSIEISGKTKEKAEAMSRVLPPSVGADCFQETTLLLWLVGDVSKQSNLQDRILDGTVREGLTTVSRNASFSITLPFSEFAFIVTRTARPVYLPYFLGQMAGHRRSWQCSAVDNVFSFVIDRPLNY